MINIKQLKLCLAASIIVVANTSNVVAGDIGIQATTPFSKGNSIRAAVKNECQLQTKLPHFISDFANKHDITVKLKDHISKKSKGKVLVLEITGTQGAGGGAWSGKKSVQAKGELFENGKSIGNFTANRYSGGGFFAAYKGTCSIMGRCVKTMGKDIALWLQNPTKNTHLGD